MKKVSIIILIAIIGINLSLAEKTAEYIFVDKDGNDVNIYTLLKAAANNDVIFFGEKHGNSIAHRYEFELLKFLYKTDKSIAIGMEMFEVDVQAQLDKYLAGEVSSEFFLSNSRPWDNYETDYSPIIEFARENGLHVIAANIPRRLASMVAKGGIESWESLPDEDKAFLPREYKFLDDDYKEYFFATMQDNPMMGRMRTKIGMDNLYYAQCVKDEKMAESIADFFKENPDHKMIVYCGAFHSDYRLGIIQKLLLRSPKLKIMTISTVQVPEDDPLDSPKLKPDYEKADFILFTR